MRIQTRFATALRASFLQQAHSKYVNTAVSPALLAIQRLQSPSDTEAVLYESIGKVANITLNRPDKLNTVNDDLRKGLDAALKKVAADPEICVVVLRGAGRAFSAGADMSGGAATTRDVQGWRNSFLEEGELFQSMLKHPKIIIAITHGYVLGVGFWIMNACDIVFSTEDCKFGVPEIRQHTSTGFMINPANIPRNKMMMMLAGDHFDARTAEWMGLVSKVISKDRIEKEVGKFVRKLCLVDPIALMMNKAEINAWYRVPEWESIMRTEVENCAVLYTSSSRKKWLDVRAKGISMREYLELRDGPYKKIDEEP